MRSPRRGFVVLGALLSVLMASTAQAETLRLLTWGNYAPDKVIEMFEKKYPDIKVEVTFSNNEEMVAKLRATGGAGFDLAQPSHDRIFSAQKEFNIYKPMDLTKIDLSVLDEKLLAGVKANTTIDGEVYAVPHEWGTSGIMVDKTKAPEIKSWADLCDEKYKGKTSMRLRRTILLGTAFAMGKDPFAAYGNLDDYKKLMDEVAEKLIACKAIVKTYWKAGDDLSALMLSGEVIASETWDSTAYKLYSQNPNIVFVPPETGALAWIDTFALPRKGEADEAAYKWINFVMQPDIVPLMSDKSGAVVAVKDGIAKMPEDKRKAVQAAFKPEDIANLKFFANIPPGLEDIEGKTLERIQAATAN
ncbi:spermidine/putrescine transport system substrate-binding protein [Rhodoligotrophos appendicifer]|uniref:extracellular solute-binding protein n=1 Tax=Rhodoligotrophos appendicifer TaxID=987056 RepID=UPI0011850C2C|nr:extracellular solute-binding protein [Rhodoligotrophos appendicifer]